MRNWPQTQPGASFRGFPFEVEKEGVIGAGRRVAVHDYAKAETHDTEDTGRKARRFRVTAYLASDTVDAELAALVEVCSTPGVGTLILPTHPPQQVRCTDCTTAADKDKMGYVAVDLEFIEARGAGGGLGPIALGDRIAQGALDGLADIAGAALDALPF